MGSLDQLFLLNAVSYAVSSGLFVLVHRSVPARGAARSTDGVSMSVRQVLISRRFGPPLTMVMVVATLVLMCRWWSWCVTSPSAPTPPSAAW